MREFKLRAYGHITKEMYHFDLLSYTTMNEVGQEEVLPTGQNISLMQYTGLKDKDGREIYEGDAVLLTNRVSKECVEVVFDDGCFCVVGHLGDTRTYPIRQFLFTGYQIEVLGNIYENPKLLEVVR
ncbi:YopX family protein [Metabacillus litoralis]|uniref:YopX family protein n=1 Tax=Metabacillus litoralis TaxID=152268 RepID=UPI00203EB890|nr:YopX family protein [Metabacillus litoralis]